MRYEKVYVDVTAKFLKEGGLRPLDITWIDGKRYFIDKVKFIERIPSKAGGTMPDKKGDITFEHFMDSFELSVRNPFMHQ